MNIYFIGVVISIVIFAVVGIVAGRKVKDTNDYYVAGRKAPVILIVGSLIASFLSTGAFLGDTGEVYSGFFMGIVIVGVLQASGYVYGANLFGKFIRRAEVNTVPEYFGKRFSSRRLRTLASITMIFAVTAYMLSAMQGISTLMVSITGLDYKTCVFIAWISFTVFTVYSGSKGVLITDTIMFGIFLLAALIGVPFVIHSAGGWSNTIEYLATQTSLPGMISWTNNLDYMYPSGYQNLIWAIVYGVVWAMVVMVSPWQTSRYLMAKDEHTIQRSSVWASMGVACVTIALYFTTVFIYRINPDISPASTSMIWAAMNVMPLAIGVLMLTGILSAGISSASTFLSLIGTCITNDVLIHHKNDDVKRNLTISRIVMAMVSLLVLCIAFFNPPQIFWIMYFGGTVIASAWGFVALLSVWSKKMSESAAFWGMLLGFLGCSITKTYSALTGTVLPMYLDPFFIGIIMSVIGVALGNRFKKASQDDEKQYELLHVRPDIEKDKKRHLYTYRLMYVYLIFGILLGLFFVMFYALPYMKSINR